MKQGFVYIWYDNLRKMFYIGSHWGRSDDNYLCSNDRLYNAIKKRPENFKRRIIEKDISDKKILLEREQYWLNMIKDDELSSVSSVTDNIARYYNYKKFASGGNGNANKGKNKTAWNIGITSEMLKLRREKLFCLLCDKPKPKFRNIFFNKLCLNCNIEFKTNNKQKSYCSDTCYNYHYNLKRDKNIFKKYYNNKITKQETSIIRCLICSKETPNKKFCSRSCQNQYSKVAWNKGLPNPQAALNGRLGAKKQSQKVTGRRKTLREDGSWYWKYPE